MADEDVRAARIFAGRARHDACSYARAMRFVVGALATFAFGCSTGEIVETVPSGGSTDQLVTYVRMSPRERSDLVVVVATADTNLGASLRAATAGAIREYARTLVEPRDLWNELDVRAFVASAVDGSIHGPLGVASPNATAEAVGGFREAIVSAIDAAPPGEPSAERVVATVDRALAAAGTRPNVLSRIVVVTTSREVAAALPHRGALVDTLVVAPDDGECSDRIERNGAAVQTPCSGIELRSWSDGVVGSCLPRPARACRVRALVPRGAPCDEARGLRRPLVSVPPLDSGAAELDVCDVDELRGEDAAACERGAPYAAGASGWCLPAPPPSRCLGRAPRLVGGAAPSYATIEIACELADH